MIYRLHYSDIVHYNRAPSDFTRDFESLSELLKWAAAQMFSIEGDLVRTRNYFSIDQIEEITKIKVLKSGVWNEELLKWEGKVKKALKEKIRRRSSCCSKKGRPSRIGRFISGLMSPRGNDYSLIDLSGND